MATNAETNEEYIQRKHIKELFQSLTLGLLSYRPQDPKRFLLECLSKVEREGWETIHLDAFVNTNGRKLPPVMEGVTHSKYTEDGSESGSSGIGSDKSFSSGSIASQSSVVESPGVDPGKNSLNSQVITRVLNGSLVDLPPHPSKIIRIFLSSTFSDFKAERNALTSLAYPELKRYCQQIGLDFQVVDLRWGVTDEVINDHQVSELCLREIKVCQKISAGPNFVALIGDRYGYRPFPYSIDVGEFQMLMSIAEKDPNSKVDTVRSWYCLDENASPPSYLLQPIASKLKFYHRLEEDFTEDRAKDEETWARISADIQSTLRSAALKAHRQNFMCEEDTEKYFMSVTEDEILCGLFRARDPSATSLCFFRSLEGIDPQNKKSSPNSCRAKFIDINKDGLVDEDAQSMLGRLKEKLEGQLGKENIPQYSVKWKEVALEQTDENSAYLNQFCSDFVSRIKLSIDRNVNGCSANFSSPAIQPLYNEVLHHSNLAKEKLCLFSGRDDVMERIKTYFNPEKCKLGRMPLVVSGPSGSGKTAVMAAIADKVHEWMAPLKPVVILRFLGTSPQSSNILDVFKSSLLQAAEAYGMKDIPDHWRKFEKMADTRRVMVEMKARFAKEFPERPFVQLLDSVDQMSTRYYGHEMAWVQKHLMNGSYLVISMLSDRFKCIEKTKAKFEGKENFVYLPPLSDAAVCEFIESYLTTRKRSLNPQQFQMVRKTMESCHQPLFLKLVMDQAIRWPSYQTIDENFLPSSIHTAITRLFESVEAKFGQRFTSHTLGYLTCSLNGLSVVEMEDVLSCDDEVLDEVYKYHDPPLEGVIRIPSLMWARVRERLREYLSEKLIDGKVVVSWYHRQFWETAEERYVSRPEIKRQLHRRLADLYDQENGIRRTIVLHQRGEKIIVDADRKVTPQPMNPKNCRKLRCLPHHLLNACAIDELKEKCLLNFNYLQTSIDAFGINTVMNEYKEVVESTESFTQGPQLVWDVMQVSYDSLLYDPNLFAYNILERLPVVCTDGQLGAFVMGAWDYLEQSKLPRMLPTHSMKFPSLDSPLTFTLMAGQDGEMACDKSLVVCRWCEPSGNNMKIQAFDLKTMEVLACCQIPRSSPIAIVAFNRFFICIEDVYVVAREMDSGEIIRRIPYCQEKEYQHITPRCITVAEDGKTVAIGVRRGHPYKQDGSSNNRSHSYTVVFDSKKQIVCLESIEISGRKPVDNLCFVCNDTKLVATFKNRIVIYGIPGMAVLYEYSGSQSLCASSTLTHIPEQSMIVVGESLNKGARLVLLNVEDYTVEYSPTVSCRCNEPMENVSVFAVRCKSDLSEILFGTSVSTNEKRDGGLWLWKRHEVEMEKLPLGDKVWNYPTALFELDNFKLAVVGWNNGDMSVIDIVEKQALLSFHAHGHTINVFYLCCNDRYLMSMADDHAVKLWCVTRLIQKAKSGKMSCIEGPSADGELDSSEQCVDIVPYKSYMVSASHLNEQGPKFWHLESGFMDTELTEAFDKAYKESLCNHLEYAFVSRAHATLQTFGDYLVYMRKMRDKMALFITKGLSTNVQIVAHEFFMQTYFSLVVGKEYASKISSSSDILVFLVRQNTLEIRDEKLTLLRSIDITDISQDIPNITSNNAKRKLLSYKVGVTVDMKYFLIANPSLGQSGKYFEVIDLENNNFVKRVELSNSAPWKLLEDDVYHLAILENENKEPMYDLYCQKFLKTIYTRKQFIYKCLIKTDAQTLSADLSFGSRLDVGNIVTVYNLNTYSKVAKLRGHTAEVTCVAMCPSKNFIATGSVDNTIRLWSLTTGQQVSLFHAHGAVENIKLDENNEYLVVHSVGAPQKKRGIILKLHNLDMIT